MGKIADRNGTRSPRLDFIAKAARPDDRRADLSRALRSAIDRAGDLGETHVREVLRAIATAVESGETDILGGSGQAERVRTWARQVVWQGGKEQGAARDLEDARRAVTLSLRVGRQIVSVTAERDGDQHELSGAINLALQLPWLALDAGDCARAAFSLLHPHRRDQSLPIWALEEKAVQGVTGKKQPTPEGFVRAVLRALGFEPKRADDAVRDVIRVAQRRKNSVKKRAKRTVRKPVRRSGMS